MTWRTRAREAVCGQHTLLSNLFYPTLVNVLGLRIPSATSPRTSSHLRIFCGTWLEPFQTSEALEEAETQCYVNKPGIWNYVFENLALLGFRVSPEPNKTLGIFWLLEDQNQSGYLCQPCGTEAQGQTKCSSPERQMWDSLTQGGFPGW